MVPGISKAASIRWATCPVRSTAVVAAYAGSRAPNTYTAAVALIRAENPDLLRLSCIHEELAQGLGLANDSPAARPSIFNDDDEFALLTTHDEKLLQMLYDPRLHTGHDRRRGALHRPHHRPRTDGPNRFEPTDLKGTRTHGYLRLSLRRIHRRHPLDRRHP